MLVIYAIWAVAFLVSLVLYFKQVYSRFSTYGVKNPRVVPPFGNIVKLIFRRQSFTDNINALYFSYPEEKFIGTYQIMTPVLMLRDLDLIKKITVRDFEYFIDHRTLTDAQHDPLFGRNLFSLKGQEWKDMRSTLSPAFTSSKIRLMIPLMLEVGELMISSIKKKIREAGVGYVDLEAKELATRYSNDVIVTCAFGLKVDSHTDENNEFYKLGKIASELGFKALLKLLMFIAFPKLAKKLKISLIEKKSERFIKGLVLNAMKERENNKIHRPDMIHLLMEAKKGRLLQEEKTEVDDSAGFSTAKELLVGHKNVNRVWSDDDLVAQALQFYMGGFDTVATVMSFALYELAVNSDIQERLVHEIRENIEMNNGKFDYTSIQNMTYMDMVVSEVLRMWPTGIAVDRVCNKDYNLGKPNAEATQDYFVRKGESVNIPIWGIHHDPKYHPHPYRFDPERFSVENRHKIESMSYIPFGLGPRNCIASRFALCEVKVMLYHLLQTVEVYPCKQTTIPAEVSVETFNLRMKGGVWLRFRIREE